MDSRRIVRTLLSTGMLIRTMIVTIIVGAALAMTLRPSDSAAQFIGKGQIFGRYPDSSGFFGAYATVRFFAPTVSGDRWAATPVAVVNAYHSPFFSLTQEK